MWRLHDTLVAFKESNEENLFYRADLGMIKVQIGSEQGRQEMIEDGLALMWDAFEDNPESSHTFRKLATVLGNQRRVQDIQRAVTMHANYPRNREDPYVQQLLGYAQSSVIPQGAGATQ
jgi:hypothetical protein